MSVDTCQWRPRKAGALAWQLRPRSLGGCLRLHRGACCAEGASGLRVLRLRRHQAMPCTLTRTLQLERPPHEPPPDGTPCWPTRAQTNTLLLLHLLLTGHSPPCALGALFLHLGVGWPPMFPPCFAGLSGPQPPQFWHPSASTSTPVAAAWCCVRHRRSSHFHVAAVCCAPVCFLCVCGGTSAPPLLPRPGERQRVLFFKSVVNSLFQLVMGWAGKVFSAAPDVQVYG